MTELDRTELYFGYFALDARQRNLEIRKGLWHDTEGSSPESCRCDPDLRFPLDDEKSVVAKVARTATPLYIRECPNGEHWIRGYQVRSAFLVPLGGEGPCDVLALLSHEIDGIDASERALIMALVGYLAEVESEAGRGNLRVRQLERGLRRIALELSELGVDAAGRAATYPSALVDRLRLVSPREWEVLERLRTGLRVSTIARELEISPNTVRNHLKSIYRKLGVRSQTELLEQLRADSQPSEPVALRAVPA